jgi:hypothetical protein
LVSQHIPHPIAGHDHKPIVFFNTLNNNLCIGISVSDLEQHCLTSGVQMMTGGVFRGRSPNDRDTDNCVTTLLGPVPPTCVRQTPTRVERSKQEDGKRQQD